MSNSRLINKIDFGFTQVPNDFLNNKELSMKAKFLFIYMLSKPNNWQFTMSGIASQNQENRQTVSRILDELISLGYVSKTEVARNKGKFTSYDYELFYPARVIKSNTVKKESPCSINRVVKSNTSNKDKAILKEEEEENTTNENNTKQDLQEPLQDCEIIETHNQITTLQQINLERIDDFLHSQANLNRAKNPRVYQRAIRQALTDATHKKHQETLENYQDYIKETIPQSISIFDLYER